jgi:hypothetical protein
MLGSFLIRATGQALSVFYAAVIFTSLYSFFLWFILPESVTEQQMTRARAKYNDDLLRGAPKGSGVPLRLVTQNQAGRLVSSVL